MYGLANLHIQAIHIFKERLQTSNITTPLRYHPLMFQLYFLDPLRAHSSLRRRRRQRRRRLHRRRPHRLCLAQSRLLLVSPPTTRLHRSTPQNGSISAVRTTTSTSLVQSHQQQQVVEFHTFQMDLYRFILYKQPSPSVRSYLLARLLDQLQAQSCLEAKPSPSDLQRSYRILSPGAPHGTPFASP